MNPWVERNQRHPLLPCQARPPQAALTLVISFLLVSPFQVLLQRRGGVDLRVRVLAAFVLVVRVPGESFAVAQCDVAGVGGAARSDGAGVGGLEEVVADRRWLFGGRAEAGIVRVGRQPVRIPGNRPTALRSACLTPPSPLQNGNDYGYDDDNKAADGSIPSGPAGSGVVVITTILMLVATGTLFSKFLKWNPNAAQEAKI